MDPCTFVRIIVSDLSLKFPRSSKPSKSIIHPSTSPCFCKIKLSNFPTKLATIPLLIPQDDNPNPHSSSHSIAACFNLNKTQVENLSKKKQFLKISVYTGRIGTTTCGLNSSNLVGNISIPLDLGSAESKTCVYQNGWVAIGKNNKGSFPQLHLNIRSEPDPRFVFQFDGEPQYSPQVFLVQGSTKQPVFTCKFGIRSSSDLNSRTMTEQSSTKRSWLHSLRPQKDHNTKERKGWSITIHDLSGSPVALASMVTPFVASPGSDSVSRPNPGAWLIFRPGEGTWKPWGRLEAWRVRGSGTDSVGYRFELDSGYTFDAATLANSTVSSSSGGKFTIDVASGTASTLHGMSSQTSFEFVSSSGSRPGSGSSGSDFGFGLGPSQASYKGFVMSSGVKGMKNGSVKPEVEVGVQHVACSEDAAAFVALAAAVNLSVDACRLFSQKLNKELRQ